MIPVGNQNKGIVMLRFIVSVTGLALLMVACGGGSQPQSGAVSAQATHLRLTVPATALTRESLRITVTALDGSNNPTTSYTGSVQIASSDGQALLPTGTVAISSGSGVFNATMQSIGTQTLTATDAVQASIAGTSSPIEIGAALAIVITSGTPPGGTVGSGYAPHHCRSYFCPPGFGLTATAELFDAA